MFSKKTKLINHNLVEMSEFSKKSVPSIIVSDLNIQGDLVSEGAIEIGGKVTGNVLCDHVTIRKGAEITGNIKAKQLVVHGLVNGEISSGHVSVTSSGQVKGSIEYGYMSIESGADIEGTCKKIAFEDDIIQAETSEDTEFIPKIETIMNNNSKEETDDNADNVLDIVGNSFNTEEEVSVKHSTKKKKKKKRA